MKTKRSVVHSRGWLIGLSFVVALSASSQEKSWEGIGPEGGNITAIAQDTSNRNVLIAATYGYPGSIFKTTDHGLHWSLLSTVPDNVQGLIIDSRGGGAIYAYSYYTLYKSTDGGQVWNPSYLSLPMVSGYLYDIVLDPSNASIIHGAGECWSGRNYLMAYFKSTDGGATWSYKTLTTEYGWANAIDVETTNPQTIYVGGYGTVGGSSGGKLFKSTNGGNDFSDKSPGSDIVQDILVDPTASGRLFVATSGLCRKSTDGGTSWSACSQSIYSFLRMTIDGSNPASLLAATSSTVYLSTDGGASWTAKTDGISGSGCGGLIIEKSSPNTFFFANSAGIFRSTDKGTSWGSCNGGIVSGSITALGVPRSAGSSLFAGMLNNTVYKFSRAGAPSTSWQALDRFYVCSRINSIVISPTDTNVVFAGEGGG